MAHFQSFTFTFLAGLLLVSTAGADPTASRVINLDGAHLDAAQIMQVSEDKVKVRLASSALSRMKKSFDLMVEATKRNLYIYGVNHGVGGNADATIFTGSLLAPVATAASERFNAQNLRATSAGVGDDLDSVAVRSMMLIRLNDLLVGLSGARPQVAMMYEQFLNLGIIPAVPAIGSVGEADISILSHIGLAMMGEGQVYFSGKKIPADEALRLTVLVPLRPIGVDSLAIMSSNAYGLSLLTKALVELKKLSALSELLLAVSIEGIDANASHLYEVSNLIRPVPEARVVSEHILQYLAESHILTGETARSMEGLSFDTAHYHLAALIHSIKDVQKLLFQEINSATNNPAFVVADEPMKGASPQERKSFIKGEHISGYLLATSGFEPFHLAAQLDAMKTVLHQLSNDSAMRVIQFGKPEITGLSLFLTPGNGQLAFSASQKVVGQLSRRNQRLAPSNVTMGLAMAGGTEDVASQLPQTAYDILQMIENLYTLLGIELIHSAQAVDLRLKKNPNLKFGKWTVKFLKDLRQVVPFLEQDRPQTNDFRNAATFLRTFPIEQFHRNPGPAALNCHALFGG